MVNNLVSGVELSALEFGILNKFICKFIFGFSSAELRLEAIDLQTFLSNFYSHLDHYTL